MPACQHSYFCDSFHSFLKSPPPTNPNSIMTESKHTTSVSEKLESSQAHAKKALETTTAAALEVAELAKNNARSAYAASRGELEAAANDLKDAARHTYKDLSKTAKAKYGDLSQQALERYNEVAEQATQAAAEYKAQFEDLAEQAEDYIRDNPLRAVGITFAAGVVLGLILRRR